MYLHYRANEFSVDSLPFTFILKLNMFHSANPGGASDRPLSRHDIQSELPLPAQKFWIHYSHFLTYKIASLVIFIINIVPIVNTIAGSGGSMISQSIANTKRISIYYLAKISRKLHKNEENWAEARPEFV